MAREGPWSGLLNNPNFDSNIASLADFMAGYVYQSIIMQGDQERLVKMNSFNLFAQDSWQATRKLNVNLGLRYEYEGPLHDGKDDLSVFNPALGGLAVVGQQVSNLYPQYWKAVSPRLGLAYQPGKGDLVIRARDSGSSSILRRSFRSWTIPSAWRRPPPRTMGQSEWKAIRPERIPSI